MHLQKNSNRILKKNSEPQKRQKTSKKFWWCQCHINNKTEQRKKKENKLKHKVQSILYHELKSCSSTENDIHCGQVGFTWEIQQRFNKACNTYYRQINKLTKQNEGSFH